jgi:Family of unknown function (DUF6644)
MAILHLFQWIQSTEPMTAFRESGLVYPITMSLHLTGMGLFGGMIAITDLRLLGVVMKNSKITDVVQQLKWWKWIGFVLVVGCGALLLGSKAELYYYNPFYWTKMALLALVGVHALMFRSVYGNTAALDAAPKIPGKAKLAATISLLIWVGLVTMGRSIAYFDVPADKVPVYGADMITSAHHQNPPVKK